SNGNTINIKSVGRINLTDFNDLTNLGSGILPIFNTTDSLVYPSTVSAGFVNVRNTANTSGDKFALWTSGDNINELLINTSGDNGWNGWETIATRECVNTNFPVGNYLRLAGGTMTGAINFASVTGSGVIQYTSVNKLRFTTGNTILSASSSNS